MGDRKPGILVLADDMTGAAEIGGMAFQYLVDAFDPKDALSHVDDLRQEITNKYPNGFATK